MSEYDLFRQIDGLASDGAYDTGETLYEDIASLAREGIRRLPKTDQYRAALQKIAAYKSGGILDNQDKMDRHAMIHIAREALK